MLNLKKVCKEYVAGNNKVQALVDIDLAFRKSEFVSILGPSGSGKTTLLNIIGGLDKYTSGELSIVGKSTVTFSSRDWDFYRNQRIGFIFQSYNLIPHQNVLSNVELALTISGINKNDRKKRAIEALEKVGLGDQLYKKPNQLSGGQCQRVAIARALVNNPEILLADEPTGALDTKTSKQIMELIKEIAQDRLVIMVTHNPELAEQYSSRIINLLDGKVVTDTNPFSSEEEEKEVASLSDNQKNKKSKAKMSLGAAFNLSFKNLLSKRKRSILIAIAGSIGIIGVSSVLSVSNGVTNYIVGMQDDMLSGYPVQVKKTALDIGTILTSFSNQEKIDFLKKENLVNVDSVLEYLIKNYANISGNMTTNIITKEYLKYIEEMDSTYLASLSYQYNYDLLSNIYTDFTTKEGTEETSLLGIKKTFTKLLEVSGTKYAKYSDLITELSDLLLPLPFNENYVSSQYNVLKGKIASEYNEINIVVDKNRSFTDIALGQLGYYSQDEFFNIAEHAINPLVPDPKKEFTFEELMGKTFTYYPNDTVYKENDGSISETRPYDYLPYNDGSFENGVNLKIVGILEPKANISYGCLKRGFYYTNKLSSYIQNLAKQSLLSTFLRSLEGSLTNVVSKISGTQTPVVTRMGITYEFHYKLDEETGHRVDYAPAGVVNNALANLLSSMGGGSVGGSITSTGITSLRTIGAEEMPEAISFYPVNFDKKNEVNKYLDVWNSDEVIILKDGTIINPEDREKIQYTDTLQLIINLINSLIQIVTTALIAFTSLSLVVSCVMIAVITYISVMERVKEIGVIRALGGRKMDVSNLFVAETVILGLSSGILGIAVTYLISGVLNIVINKMFQISAIANFSLPLALLMVALSVALTVLSGMIPSLKASKQDPVNALRSE